MTKKILFLAMLLVTTNVISAQNANGGDHLPFSSKPISTGSQHDPLPKAPIQIPEVYLDGHTLSFDAAIEGCEVRLLDEDENVIFSDFIAISQTSLTLPTTLTGTFELQIIRGNFIFYCEIEL